MRYFLLFSLLWVAVIVVTLSGCATPLGRATQAEKDAFDRANPDLAPRRRR